MPKEPEASRSSLGMWIAVGVVLGAGVGVTMDRPAVGMAIGVALGVAIGVASNRRRKGSRQSDENR